MKGNKGMNSKYNRIFAHEGVGDPLLQSERAQPLDRVLVLKDSEEGTDDLVIDLLLGIKDTEVEDCSR